MGEFVRALEALFSLSSTQFTMEVPTVTSDIGCKLRVAGKILIAMMVLATAAVTTAGSASAAPTSAPRVTAIQPDTSASDSLGCSDHSLCMWVNSGFSGTKFTRTFGTVSSDTWHFVGTAFNDQASSLDNNRGFASGIAKNAPANLPDALCFVGGTTISNFANDAWPDNSPLNDSVSSYLLSSNNQFCTAP